jgi:DNA-binding response OmpR family regulator
MRILIADDDRFSQQLLQASLSGEGNQIITCAAGDEALRVLTGPESPEIAILDWMMPGLDGIDVCRKVRAMPGASTYLILLTAKDHMMDLVEGLAAGADDYIVKPFDPAELHARIAVGARLVGLQRKLAERVAELEAALQRVRLLQGLLPICSYCKKIRNDQNYWEQVEGYISKNTDVRFSHGICPECFKKIAEPDLRA